MAGIDRTTRFVVLGIIGILVAAGAGFLGGRLGSSGGGSDSASGPSLLDQIKSAGELKVGVASSPPSVYQDESGKWTGGDLIPLQDLASTLKVKFVPVATSWANMVAGLQAGKYDFAADLEATTERATSIQFTDPVWSSPGVFLVPSDTKLRTSDAIIKASEALLVVSGSEQDIAITPLHKNLQRLPDYNSAVLALIGGRAPAIFAGLGPAEKYAGQYPQLKIVVPNPPIIDNGVSYGVRPGIDAQSLAAVNVAIHNSITSGSISRAFAAQGFVAVDDLGNLELAKS